MIYTTILLFRDSMIIGSTELIGSFSGFEMDWVIPAGLHCSELSHFLLYLYADVLMHMYLMCKITKLFIQPNILHIVLEKLQANIQFWTSLSISLIVRLKLFQNFHIFFQEI